jgi:hypothetical protein
MRIPDPEAIARAEARLADVQSALDEVRHILRTAEKVERTGIRAFRPVAIAVAGSVLTVIVVSALRRRHGASATVRAASPAYAEPNPEAAGSASQRHDLADGEIQ